MLDVGSNPRLGAIPGLLDLIDATGVAVATIRKVASSGSTTTYRRGLPLIPLVSPDARLVTVQQMRQRLPIVHVGGRGQDRVDQFRPTVDPDERPSRTVAPQQPGPTA